VSAAEAAVAEGGGCTGAAVAETVTAAGADALPASSIGGERRRRLPSRDRGGGRSCCRHPWAPAREGSSE